MMEYRHLYFIFIGIAGLMFWSLEYWKIFKKPELQIPGRAVRMAGVFNYLRWFVFLIGMIGWLFISYSLTGPRSAQTFKPAEIEVKDIFFVVDVSRSMLAEDFKPNRLEVAKKKIREFISMRPTDRIGIVIFSEKAFTLLPLTTDLALIDKIVKDIRVGYLGSGTAIGDALGLALARGIRSEAESKVIILLTDGVNNVGNLDPLKSAQMAQEQGIKIYTIGVGGKKDAKLSGYRIIPGGSIDFDTLKEIAQISNGGSYIAQDSQALSRVFLEIERLEKSKIKSQAIIVFNEQFHKMLLIGILLLGLCEIGRRTLLKEVA